MRFKADVRGPAARHSCPDAASPKGSRVQTVKKNPAGGELPGSFPHPPKGRPYSARMPQRASSLLMELLFFQMIASTYNSVIACYLSDYSDGASKMRMTATMTQTNSLTSDDLLTSTSDLASLLARLADSQPRHSPHRRSDRELAYAAISNLFSFSEPGQLPPPRTEQAGSAPQTVREETEKFHRSGLLRRPRCQAQFHACGSAALKRGGERHE